MDEVGGNLTWLDKMHQVADKLDRDSDYCHDKASAFEATGNVLMAHEFNMLADDLTQYAKDLRIATHNKVSDDLHETEERGRLIVEAALAGAGALKERGSKGAS